MKTPEQICLDNHVPINDEISHLLIVEENRIVYHLLLLLSLSEPTAVYWSVDHRLVHCHYVNRENGF